MIDTDEVDLRDMPRHLVLTGSEQTLRRERVTVGKHRTWRILPRYGTAESDRWTVIGTPIPGGDNPCADYEDGQFPSLMVAKRVLATCLELDNGSHQED